MRYDIFNSFVTQCVLNSVKLTGCLRTQSSIGHMTHLNAHAVPSIKFIGMKFVLWDTRFVCLCHYCHMEYSQACDISVPTYNNLTSVLCSSFTTLNILTCFFFFGHFFSIEKLQQIQKNKKWSQQHSFLLLFSLILHSELMIHLETIYIKNFLKKLYFV